MPEPTLKLVAQRAGVAPVTVSRVLNGSENVAAATREKVLATVRDLDYTPNVYAANLRRNARNGETPANSNHQLICAGKHLRAGSNPRRCISCPPHRTLIFTPEERQILARHLLRLQKDLNRLSKQTHRLQTCVDMIQQAGAR